ncbi:MAG: hypothetical protein LAO77_08470 [Acidobacteriia bacterium]|nr:hypothetical protein [Terriglobia bacterium]
MNSRPAVGFDAVCALLETALRGATRQEIVEHAATATDFRRALVRLRDGMRAHAWTTASLPLNLASSVSRYDTKTRQEGFHALNDWDGLTDHVNADTIPVDVLNFLIENRGEGPPDPIALAILLDYYFMHVLALASLRVWDEGRADEQLDRLQSLLRDLQGSNGSGQLFAADAESLILIATCHYEREERGYDLLLERVQTLSHAHRVQIALGHAASIGSHLRFGFEATYARDTTKTRDDNVADYPWLCFALATLMREYARMQAADVHGLERDRIVEALLNGLSPDARAFVGDHPPASLLTSEAERVEFRDLFRKHRSALLDEFERFRPQDEGYSPLAFFFNFSHNVLKGTVVDALLRGEPWPLTLNDLLTGVPADDSKNTERRALAQTLMGYARAHPSPIRGRMMPVIVYDPATGRQSMSVAMGKMRE